MVFKTLIGGRGKGKVGAQGVGKGGMKRHKVLRGEPPSGFAGRVARLSLSTK